MAKSAKNEFEIVVQKSKSEYVETLAGSDAVVMPKQKAMNADQENLALSLAAEGKTIKSICEILNVENDAILLYQKNNPLFKKQFVQARDDGHEALADSLIDIAASEPDVLRARVKSDNIKWLLSKRKAHVYGDKLEVNINATVDIGQALSEARSRAFNVNTLDDLLS